MLLKHGNFTGILITAGSSKLRNLTVKGDTGNGGDGIQVAAPRVVLEDVSSINQAGVGVRVGVTAAHAIADLTEFRGLTVRGNTGDGLYMHDDDADGGIDANTATGNVFAEGNGGNGITLEKAQANRFTYWAEANTGYGVEVKAQVAAGKNELHGHAEGNGVGQVHFDSGSSENLVITPDVGTVVDLGTNQIWDGSGFVTRVPLTVHSTGVFTGTLGAAPGGTASAWKKYSLIKVANGVNGCAQPNGCFQVNGSSPGVTAPAAFSVAGILYTGSNFSLVENVAVVPAVACTGATTATLSVGSSNAGGTFYTAAYDIQTAPADIGRTQFTAPMKYFQKTAESATWTITTTISNVDQLIAGCQVDIYVKWSALP